MPTKSKVVGVLIASEENQEIPGVGVETLMASGRLDFLKDGPVIWTDSSNSQPRIGTAGAIAWTLTATGKLFHSGLPNLGINAIELALDATTKLQERFYEDFGPVEQEKAYNFACPSTIKPVKVESAPSGLNQMQETAIASSLEMTLTSCLSMMLQVLRGRKSQATCACRRSMRWKR